MARKTLNGDSATDTGWSIRRASRPGEVRFYTIAEVAKLLAVSSRTIRRAIDRKELVAHHFRKAVRIAESDLRAFIASRRPF